MAGRTQLLGPNQEAFSRRLAKDTGLDLNVVRAWVHAEQPADSPATGRLPYNDWLNIGWTDAGRTSITYDPGWAGSPAGGADLTAAWLEGTYGSKYDYSASPGVRAILRAKDLTPAQQIRAIQSSGWASSGYPALASSYAAVSGLPAPPGAPGYTGPPTPGGVPYGGPQPSKPGHGSSFWGGVGGFLDKNLVDPWSNVFGTAESAAEATIGSTLDFMKAALWLLNWKTWLRATETIFGFVSILVGIVVMVGGGSLASAARGTPVGAAASAAGDAAGE